MEQTKTGLKVGQPCVAGNTTVLPIERIQIRAFGDVGDHRYLATKAPYAIVIYDGHELYAFDQQARRISIETLEQEVAGLDRELAALRP